MSVSWSTVHVNDTQLYQSRSPKTSTDCATRSQPFSPTLLAPLLSGPPLLSSLYVSYNISATKILDTTVQLPGARARTRSLEKRAAKARWSAGSRLQFANNLQGLRGSPRATVAMNLVNQCVLIHCIYDHKMSPFFSSCYCAPRMKRVSVEKEVLPSFGFVR
ncbi:hypothetical protein AX14_001079 [Amanita brunnescens Koide BX004]|nr:hypothetical protein AX14_001079 [Amanita brunnescens Koide BX004]